MSVQVKEETMIMIKAGLGQSESFDTQKVRQDDLLTGALGTNVDLLDAAIWQAVTLVNHEQPPKG